MSLKVVAVCFEGLARPSRRARRHFVRGSREISPQNGRCALILFFFVYESNDSRAVRKKVAIKIYSIAKYNKWYRADRVQCRHLALMRAKSMDSVGGVVEKVDLEPRMHMIDTVIHAE